MDAKLIHVVLVAFLAPAARAQFSEQNGKLMASDSYGFAGQGAAVALSADGNTAVYGGPGDSGGIGAAWVFVRSNGVWAERAKLVGGGAIGFAAQGTSVALSSGGNVAIVGAPGDNNNIGAVWVFTLSNGSWIQQAKLTGSGNTGASRQGLAVALSADGSTAVIGGPLDNNGMGAAWVFRWFSTGWTERGKLVGTGGLPTNGQLQQGISVAVDYYGNTVMVGSNLDNNATGAVWVFTSLVANWKQSAKLSSNDAVANSSFGTSVAISGDGNTAIVGGATDGTGLGAAWIFVLGSNGAWAQQGSKLLGSGALGPAQQGHSTSLSFDGNTALVGGWKDNGGAGAAWVFKRARGVWAQYGSKLAAADSVGAANQGASVALSADTATAMVGGPNDNGGMGAVWVNVQPLAIHFSVTALTSVASGSSFYFNVTALDANNAPFTGYTGTVQFTSSDPKATFPRTNGLLTYGTATFQATLNSIGIQTITATDAAVASIVGTSGPIAVSYGTPEFAPFGGAGYTQSMQFQFSDPRGYQDVDVVNILINNFLDARNSCYLAYSQPSKMFYLVGDDGITLLPLTGGSISNSQCTINAEGTSAVGTDTLLSLTVNITFSSSFGGNKILYMAARDLEGGNSGWQPLSTWQVPFTYSGRIAVGNVDPSDQFQTSAGPAASYGIVLTDTSGTGDFGVVNFLVNRALDGRQACYIAYDTPTNTLYLVDDAGDAGGPFAGSLVPGGSGEFIRNSQCIVSDLNVTKDGTTLTLTLFLQSAPGFLGNHVVWVAGRDTSGDNNTGWQAVGTWTVL